MSDREYVNKHYSKMFGKNKKYIKKHLHSKLGGVIEVEKGAVIKIPQCKINAHIPQKRIWSKA